MPEPEPVWTYRGYQLKPGEFTTAMVHFFRAEISRANIWRQRLDTTTNWAVVTTGAAISFTFSNPESTPTVILLNILLLAMFLAIEARRYRYYELWSSRVRLMETDFYAAMLVPPFHPDPDWAESLAESLLQPHFSISMWEAVGRRLRRNYIWLYMILGLAWFAKLYLQPAPAISWDQVLDRASIGPISGAIVLAVSLIYLTIVFLIALLTVGLHEASGEVLPRYGMPLTAATLDRIVDRGQAWFRHETRRQRLLALIITDQAKEISARIMTDMNRGVTAIPGTGMFTGQAHSVLLVGLTTTEVGKLKSLVREESPNAFVIVSPAQEIFGRGFSSLGEEG